MLKKCLIGKIIQCHIDHSNPESFVVGRLIYFDRDWFLMQDISPAGHWNGLALYMRSDIVSIAETTDYIFRIASLLKCRNEPTPFMPSISNDPLMNLLLYAKEAERLIALELLASGYRDVCGKVGDLSQNTLTIIQVDEFGHPDGESYVAINAITRLYIDDEESACLELLMTQGETWLNHIKHI